MQKSEMLQLRLDGKSYKAISLLAGVSRQRVQQILCPPSAIRKSVVNRAGGQCEVCSIFVGNTGHVHHKNNDEDYNDLPNLQLLCPSCHRRKHHPTGQGELSHSNSKVLGVRPTLAVAAEIKRRCAKRGISVNQWLTRAIDNQLRKR